LTKKKQVVSESHVSSLMQVMPEHTALCFLTHIIIAWLQQNQRYDESKFSRLICSHFSSAFMHRLCSIHGKHKAWAVYQNTIMI